VCSSDLGGALSSARHVDGVRAPRQAGSTLKPFLYALALEQRLLTAASLLEDSPVNLETPTGLYVPQNYDRLFRGMTSLRASLAGSLNVPAVRTLMLLGPDAFVTRLRELGFDGIDRDGDYYGYALALGSAEVTLWQLVNAYRTLANGGRRGALSLEASGAPTSTGPVAARRVAASFVVGDVLADRAARSASFGVDNALNLPFWAAVKTGTSKQMRDNWCVGYTARYTVGVWIGNFDGAPMWEVSGLSGAAPVWAEVMSQLHAMVPGAPPAPPPGVERHHVDFEGIDEPAREEWFLRGTATPRIALHAPTRQTPRIAYPGGDSILVVDPDIPPAHQRVFFAMRPSRADYTWALNGETLAGDAWSPTPGRYTLELLDPAGQRVDQLRYTVRGTRQSAAE
ncbi:MAG: penicillin-binding transpeptidase domain-containing protein, partial [Gammaproteobacteria bacterium]